MAIKNINAEKVEFSNLPIEANVDFLIGILGGEPSRFEISSIEITESQISDFGAYVQITDIDTFVELDGIVADANLVKEGDNVSVFTNDGVYMTEAVYDPAGIAQQLVGISAFQTVSNKTLTNTTSIGFDTTYSPTGNEPQGTIYWNEDDQTVDVVSGGVTYQVGQEIAPLVRNNSGSTITNGTPVMFSGTIGASGRVTVTPAIADGSIKSSYILGITTEDILNNEDGHVTHFGKVRQIDTTGTPYGEVWNDGDLIYVSDTTAGHLTNVKPNAPSSQIFVAVVVFASATVGELFVRPSWRGDLTDLSDVNGTALTTNGQLLVWDNDNQFFDFTHNINDYFLTADTKPFKETVSTGIVSGGELSINGVDNTKFDVSAGVGYIVDITTYPATVTEVTWGAFTSQTLTNLATSFATDIAIDINGNIVQQNSFSDVERRNLIFLGGFDHSNQINILDAFSIQVPIASPANSIQELARAVGDINLFGNVYNANGVNLSIDKSGGTVFSYGRNTFNDKTDPHKITTVTQAVVSFGYVYNDGAGNGTFTTPVTSINPDNYDDGTGVLASVPVNNWTIQRLLFFPNDNKTFVQYGTASYNKKEEALNAVPRAVFEPLSGIRTAMVRGYLIVRQGETDLSSLDTVFLSADRFGIVAGFDGGSSLVSWGNITGTLSDQLDLQAELDGKSDVGHTHVISDITDFTDNSTNWNNAFSWGDHALAGYLLDITGESITDLSDVVVTTPINNDIFVYQSGFWVNSTLSGANISEVGHTHVIADITDFTDNSTNWNTAFGWGDHALAGYELLANKGVANGYAPLNSSGKIPNTHIPALAISDTFVVASQAAMLALTTAETGDVAVRTDENKSYILRGADYATLADWQELLSPTNSVASVNGLTGTVVIDLSFVAGDLSITGGSTVDLDARYAVLGGHTHPWTDITATPTTLAGYGITDAYTDSEIDLFFNGTNPILGYNKTNWDLAFGWGDHALAGYLTSFDITTQTDPKYLRSDVADVKTAGNLIFNDNVVLQFGTTPAVNYFYDGAYNRIALQTADLRITDGASPRFTFERTTGDFTSTGGVSSDYWANGGTGSTAGSASTIFTDRSMPVHSLVLVSNTTNSTGFPYEFSQGLYIKGASEPRDFALLKRALDNDAKLYLGYKNASTWTWTQFITQDNASTELTQFLRSDVSDTKTAGNLTFNDGVRVVLGTGGDAELFHSADNNYFDLNNGDFFIRDINGATLTRFTFGRTTGNFIATGTVQGTRLISTQATGTAPLTISSTTNVSNLNADLWDDYHIPTGFAKTSNPFTIVATGEWDLPVGGAIFSQPTSVGGTGSPGYWFVTGRRDVSGGYSGIYTSYSGGDSWIGSAADGTTDPTWHRIITDANASTQLGQFLRSDVADSAIGLITFVNGALISGGDLSLNNNIQIDFGTVSDLYTNGTSTLLDMSSGNFVIRDGTTTRFTFERTSGDLTLATGTYNGDGSGLTGVMLATGVRTTGDASAILINSVRPYDISSATDEPSGSNDGIITTGMWDSTAYGAQQFHDFHNNTLWLRQRNASVWGSWAKVLTDTNASTELTQFLRSDVADTKTAGNLGFYDNVLLYFGVDADSRIGFDGTNTEFNLVNGDLVVQDNGSTRFTFGRTTGNFTASGIITGTGEIKSTSAGAGGKFTLERTGASASTYTVTNISDTIEYNYVNGSGGYKWRTEGTERMSLTEAGKLTVTGDLTINGNLDIKEITTAFPVYSDIANERPFITHATGANRSLTLGVADDGVVPIYIHLNEDNNPGTSTIVMGAGNAGNILEVNSAGIGITGTGTYTRDVIINTDDRYFTSNSTLYKFGASQTIGVRMGTATGGGIDSANQPEIDFRRWTGTGTVHNNSRISVARKNGDGSWGLGFYVSSEATNVASSTVGMYIDTTQQVGIGTNNPVYKLDVNGVGRFQDDLTVRRAAVDGTVAKFTDPHIQLEAGTTADNSGYVGISMATSTVTNYGYTVGAQRTTAGQGDFMINFHNNSALGVTRFFIDESGNVGIGNTNNTYKLDVSGTVRSTGDMTATDFVQSSDKRLKRKIKDFDYQQHIEIDVKTYELKGKEGVKRTGVIAQELEKKHPEFVRTDKEGMKSVSYTDLLMAKIAELEARLEKAGL